MQLPVEALFPFEQLRPKIHLSPFDSGRVDYNAAVTARTQPTPIRWEKILPGNHRSFALTRNGREAIGIALTEIGLAKQDEVVIVTTSGSSYISRCVTDEIERVCRWSRTLGPAARAIFVIHDFGFPAAPPLPVNTTKLPIIEDCAYAFGSANCGVLGDYVVYSLSKAFPIQYGGLLCARTRLRTPSSLSPAGRAGLTRLLNHYLPSRTRDARRRRACFTAYETALAAHGYEPLFPLEPRVIPHAFVVRLKDEKRAARVRAHMNDFGIESSVYYGGGGYYFPNHQNLGPAQIEYIIRHFLNAAQRRPRTKSVLGART